MKLFLVNSVDFPFGGPQSIHVSLIVKGLRENNEDAILIIPYGLKREVLSSNKNKYGHYDGVPYYFVRKNKKIKKIFRFLDIFIGVLMTSVIIFNRKRKRNIDALVLYNPDILRDCPIIFTCLLCKIPLYFWFVEKMSLSNDYKGIPGFLNYLSQKLSESLLPRLCSGIIVISTHLKRHYVKYLNESKILLSPILVSENMHRIVNNDTIEKTKEKVKNIFQYRRLLLYSGSYGEKDGVHYLIDAFAEIEKRHPDTLFIMTGKNHSELIMNSVNEHICKLNLQNNIKLLGFVNAEELLCYNSIADILFACRTNSSFANHGFPWKLGEYCMTARPIITTDVSDIKLYFKDNNDIFIIESNNSKALTEKVLFIFDNYDLALKIAENGKKTALQCFQYSEKTKEVKEFIRRNNSRL